MNSFESFLREAGLIPRTIAADGRWRRCPTVSQPSKQNGAYNLAQDGQVGWCQDWATQNEAVMWRPERVYIAPPPDYAGIARRAEQERRRQREAIEGARAFFRGCEAILGGHGYLAAHGLDMRGCFGLKIDADGWLVIPALKGRELVTVQRISPAGDKRFWAGAPVKGASYTIGGAASGSRSRSFIKGVCGGASGTADVHSSPLRLAGPETRLSGRGSGECGSGWESSHGHYGTARTQLAHHQFDYLCSCRSRRAATSARECKPSLRRICCVWCRAVGALIKSVRTISAFDFPSARSRATQAS